MATPDNALQAAIYTRLTNFSALTAALGDNNIFDFVQPDQNPPYVVIGEDTLTDDSTKTEGHWDCTVTIHVWDYEKAGRKSVKTLLSHIHDALHRQEVNISVSGYGLTEIRLEFQQVIQETGVEGEGDHYYHGIARYRAHIGATS